MIAVDTNVLVYAHRQDSEWHGPALAALTSLAEGGGRWGIPWPCVHEFISIVTHPRIYRPPSPLPVAFDAVQAWMDAPTCVLLGEGPGYFGKLRSLGYLAKVAGPQIHDARIAAICLHWGVRALWTADRDFSRFAALPTHNPLLSPPPASGLPCGMTGPAAPTGPP